MGFWSNKTVLASEETARGEAASFLACRGELPFLLLLQR